MGSMLQKGIRAGMAGLSKGLFRKYEHQLKEEEAEADLLRKQHLASYENSLLTNRAKVLKEHEADLQLQTEKKKALQAGDIADEVTTKESGKLWDSMNERGVEGLPNKEDFKKDMLFIARASKGATPLSNDQKIEIIKNANEAWDKLSTLGGPEFDKWIANYGPDKARSKFIESQINSDVFGGTSMLSKAGKVVSKEKEKQVIEEIKTGEPEAMIKKIMKSQKVKRPEAIKIYEQITAKPFLQPDKSKRKLSFFEHMKEGLSPMEKEDEEEKDESMLFNY